MSKSYKWFLIAMLSCAFFFHQADRALFGLLTCGMPNPVGVADSPHSSPVAMWGAE